MFRKFTIAWIVTVFVPTAMCAGQESPPRSASDAGISISVNLAQTDVVVVDRAGHPVHDLEAADFQLFDNGHLQTITNFSWVEVTPTQPGARRGRHSNSVLPPASIPRREDLRRAMVLMVDDAGTNTSDLVAILPAIRRFVAEEIKPGDIAAVAASRGGMGMYEQLTADKNQLYAAIDRIGRRPQWLSCDYVPPFVSENNQKYFGYAPGAFIFSPNACALAPADKNGNLRRAIEGLSTAPGRKAVVLFSHLFGVSPANVALANRAGVVIYVLDPGGGNPAIVRVPGPLGVKGSSMLAEQTGGFRKLTAPGQIGQDLAEVMDEMSGYYVLGYHLAEEDAESLRRGPARSIQVRVLREGMTVRARNSLSRLGADSADKTPRTKEQYLQQALFTAFNYGGLQVGIEPAYRPSLLDSGRADSRPGQRGIDLSVYMTVENEVEANPASLTLDTLSALYRADGSTASSAQREITISRITPEMASRYRRYGIRFRTQLEVKQPGNYQLRVAVRDPATGRFGAAYSFLSIPDFNRARLALATPVLGSPERSDFAPGESASFSCEMFGSAAPKTEGEIVLYSETGPLGDARPLKLRADTSGSFLEGDMPLPASLPAGEYAIRLITWDRGGGPSKFSGGQWSRLRIRD